MVKNLELLETRQVSQEDRQKTVNLFLEKLATYTKRNRLFSEENGVGSPITYILKTPPYTKQSLKNTPAVSHQALETRLFLFTDFLVLLTEFTPEKAAEAGRFKQRGKLKYALTEVASKATLGISDIALSAVEGAIPSKSMALIGKDPDDMLVNPWSHIIPVDDIVNYELLKVAFTLRYLYLHVNHRFEGEYDIGMTYHSGGIHMRADSLYKKLNKLMKKRKNN